MSKIVLFNMSVGNHASRSQRFTKMLQHTRLLHHFSSSGTKARAVYSYGSLEKMNSVVHAYINYIKGTLSMAGERHYRTEVPRLLHVRKVPCPTATYKRMGDPSPTPPPTLAGGASARLGWGLAKQPALRDALRTVVALRICASAAAASGFMSECH